MKPFLKYRGGKYREIPYFEKYIPSEYETYIEPFIGGGAVFFYLEPKKAIINDVNKKLIQTYKETKEEYPLLRQQLDELQKIYEYNHEMYVQDKMAVGENIRVNDPNEDFYYKMREEFNYPSGKYLDSAIYFFINKTSYSGMIRYNKNGEFNVPFGRYKNLNTNILTQRHHELLQNTQIFNLDYSEIFNMASTQDFIFLDPPYDTIFSDYGNIEFSGDFGEDEHRKLAQDYINLSTKSLMIISKTPLTKELYNPFIVDEYEKKYAVNIRNRFKSEAKHIVVKNW